MSYSRVLTVLALLGVIGLSATLLTPNGRSAPRTTRAAAKLRPSLQSTLKQQLRQLLATTPLHPQDLQPAPAPCAVESCSENPCVVFVQSVNAPVAGAANSVELTQLVIPKGRSRLGAPVGVLPAAPGGPAGRCTRRGTPHTFRVSGP